MIHDRTRKRSPYGRTKTWVDENEVPVRGGGSFSEVINESGTKTFEKVMNSHTQ